MAQSLDKDGGKAVQNDIWIPSFHKEEFNRELPEAAICFKEDHKIESVKDSLQIIPERISIYFVGSNKLFSESWSRSDL